MNDQFYRINHRNVFIIINYSKKFISVKINIYNFF